jgi:hypothetical protein
MMIIGKANREKDGLWRSLLTRELSHAARRKR